MQSFIKKPESDEEHKLFILHKIGRSIAACLRRLPSWRRQSRPWSCRRTMRTSFTSSYPAKSVRIPWNRGSRTALGQRKIRREASAGFLWSYFYYDSILGQCCEMLIGFVQILVGIAGPLLLNGCPW